jgi:glycosyltransferase involved in cell wall biosynthesis
MVCNRRHDRCGRALVEISEHDLGWVVRPGDAGELARTIRLAASSDNTMRARRATAIARRFDFSTAMASYSDLVRQLLRKD